jgi:hypothetical protein
MSKLLLDISNINAILKQHRSKRCTEFVQIPLFADGVLTAAIVVIPSFVFTASTIQTCSHCNPLALSERLAVWVTTLRGKNASSAESVG